MNGHLSQLDLLQYLDSGESPEAVRRSAEHLQSCPSCQVQFERLKEHLGEILEAQTEVFEPGLAPPPRPWQRLEARLEQVARQNRVSWWKTLIPAPTAGWRLAYGGAGLAIAVVALSVWVSAPVSAKEVLIRAVAADSKRLAIAPRQVVKQRVRVKRTDRQTSAVQSAEIESWKSPRSAYWKAGSKPVGSELLGYYRANGLAAALPLSPEAIESWMKVAGSEPVSTPDGDAVDVHVTSDPGGRARGLEGVNFHVQRANWHLDAMTLSFNQATYTINEQESSVVAGDGVPSDVMAVLEGSEPGAEPQSIPAQRMIAPGSSGTRINLDETEMRVRYEIHGIGADLAEGIQVSASGNVVQVDARQVSPQTKERLTAALANVPGVELEFGAGESDPGRTPTRTIPEKAVSPPPADGRLGLFFGGTEAQENFTRLALERGNRLLERLYALQELSARWPARRETRLSETARRRLDSMVRDHSRAARTEASELGKQLDPLLKNFGLSTSEQTGAPASISWQDAATSGLDAARRTDRALRSILTSSDAPLSIETGMPQIQHGLADLSRFVRSLPE